MESFCCNLTIFQDLIGVKYRHLELITGSKKHDDPSHIGPITIDYYQNGPTPPVPAPKVVLGKPLAALRTFSQNGLASLPSAGLRPLEVL
jgi:hypothetical protein